MSISAEKLLRVESVAYELKELNLVYAGAWQTTILDEGRQLRFRSAVAEAVLNETNNCRLDLERILYGDETDEAEESKKEIEPG
ncbi:MAG: hypothetical protein IJS71_08365 [Clostridia bacterium]|nr:hypothetical protein [Clostridia bacterium]